MMQINSFKVEKGFPTVITPDLKPLGKNDFLDSLKQNQTQIRALLLEQGGLLFRGFPINNAADFSQVVETLGLGKFADYIGGDTPRDKVEKQVYTSTEAPPEFHIPLHQELSFIKEFPRHIYFFCEIAAAVGGATIIGDARRISKALDPEVKQRFKDKGLMYISHYYYKSKIMQWLNKFKRSHKSWTEVFETQHKNEVEKKCLENDFIWKWFANDWLEIKQERPAIVTHPLTQDEVWFNQAHLYDFNPKLMGWKKYLGAKLFYFRPSTRMHEILFADGSVIPRKDLYHIMDVLHENTVYFPWQKGDVMVLDNILAMHGRAPFSGKRRVLAAMTS